MKVQEHNLTCSGRILLEIGANGYNAVSGLSEVRATVRSIGAGKHQRPLLDLPAPRPSSLGHTLAKWLLHLMAIKCFPYVLPADQFTGLRGCDFRRAFRYDPRYEATAPARLICGMARHACFVRGGEGGIRTRVTTRLDAASRILVTKR